MSLVTPEDERRIYEKYGDMLKEIEDAPEELNEEECMARLPEDAPISTGIFTRGFYYTGTGIKYRSSFWAGWWLIGSHGGLFAVWDILTKCIFMPAGIFAFSNGNLFLGIAFWAVGGVIDNIGFVFSNSLCPRYEIDLSHKIIKTGRLFIQKIPFYCINKISIYEQCKLIRGPKGSRIYLVSSQNDYWIHIATLLPWEDYQWTEIIRDSLIELLEKDIKVEYFIDGERVM